MNDYIPIIKRIEPAEVRRIREEYEMGLSEARRHLIKSFLLTEISRVEDERLKDILYTMVLL